MFEFQKLKLASILYKSAFPLYRVMYFNFKKKKDADNLALLSKLIKPGSTILDIGANIGFFSKFFAERTGEAGMVYCFEPDATNFKHLQKELTNIPNVSLFQKAVAAQNGKLLLYTSDLLNVDHRTYEPENYNGKYEVEKISIDRLIEGKFKVDLIKMDIQGFEMDALRGMISTLKLNNDVLIFTEFWPYGLLKGGSSAVALYDFFNDLKFNVYHLLKNKLTLLTREEVLQMKVEYMVDTNVWVSRIDLEGFELPK